MWVLVLTEKGMSVRAVLAQVIGGAGASIPELTLLSAIFEKKLLAAFVLTIFAMALFPKVLGDPVFYLIPHSPEDLELFLL